MSGKLEDIVNSLIFRADLIYFFNVIRDGTTPTVTNYQFDRYVTLLDGIEKMLASKGYKLEISYSELGGYYEYRDGEIEYNTEGRFPRYIKCVPILDYGSEIEVSQDSKMDFVSNDNRRGCNHLVCLGKGELKDRIVVNLYVDSQDGSITRDDQGYGADEVARVYDNPGAEETDLVEYGTEYLKTLMSKKEFTAKAKYIDDINLGIGDTITGKDLITGTVVTKPIKQKIVKIVNGIATVNYKL